ncbi:MAG: tRNA (N(6)-L-threonylcarbamoyladenosine(37)-C(2))-methylthiotransferase MtaB [Bacilli bacterium]|nr:tRNA (N(6)-L-threonylcarbamoyladenosine(37)-C(2))-methylthiotransferase MtaB [Bacilli bacterium]
MKVGIYTLGCKVNTYESEFIISLFKNRGYQICNFDDDCDIYIINTCTVTNNSDRKDRKIINSIKNKNACKVVCGCFVESAKDYDYTGIDVVIGNYNKSNIVDYVEEYLKTKKQIIVKDNMMTVPFEDMEIDHLESRTRAFVKIQDGCENYCAYCIIPFVRGRCRSKEKDKVISEITSLVNNGYKEVVLTGIHTGSYGIDLGIKFSDLIEELLDIPGLERLRISSIEITELDDKFFKLLENKKLCNHLHVPLQSGSSNVLKLMNRKYTKNEYKKQIDKIRKVRPDISITTDVIVGFPQETDDDFKECLDFCKEINFAKIHVFPYSKRNGTKASRMSGHIDGITKKERARKLLKLSEELESDYYNKNVGKKEKILIEIKKDGYYYGHTSNYLYLKVKGNYKENEIYDIEVNKDMFTDNSKVSTL